MSITNTIQALLSVAPPPFPDGPKFALAQALERWADVRMWRDTIREFFPNAVAITIGTDNDGDGTYVNYVSVYDADDNVLSANDLEDDTLEEFTDTYMDCGVPQSELRDVKFNLDEPPLTNDSREEFKAELKRLYDAVDALPDGCFSKK